MSKPTALHFGEVGQPINHSHALRSGGESYSAAVVINVNPFVLSTGDMRWSATVVKEGFEFVRRATPEELKLALTRLTE